MIKITKLNNFNNMSDEQKEQYIDIVYENCPSTTINFFQSNKDYIKKELTGSAGRLFEAEVIKQKKLEKPFLKQIIEKLDDERMEKLNIKVIKALIKDKGLVKSLIDNKEYNENQLVKYLAQCDDEKSKVVRSIFDCLGIDINITAETIKLEENNIKFDQLQEKLKKQEEEIEKLKKKNIDDKVELEKKYKEKDKKKTNEINELKDKIKEIESTRTIKKEVEQKEENNSNNSSKKEVTISNEPIISNENLAISIESAIEDLEGRTFLGVVKAEGIQPGKSWIIVTPIVPIINENANINREEFMNQVDYRSDYSTFMLFINRNLLEMCLPEDEVENYLYYTNEEKFSCLFEAFCKKILFFTPQFVDTHDGGKLKLNAVLVTKPIEYEDFVNSTFVPSIEYTRREFEAKVARHDDLVLKNYPASLSSKLKYVFVKNSIYEISYVPSEDLVDNKYIKWKYNGQEGKPPFRKLDIIIGSDSNDKYILTPSSWEDKTNDLYVKNIMLIQPSQSNSIFNEDEFISKVSENAKSRNLFYEEEDLKNFHISIKSSNLVILAGPSGIGKTKLPMVYANTLGLDVARNTVLFVPISPSYLEPEDVLGYIRPIYSKEEKFNAEYMEAQTGLVSFLIDASEHKDRIHFVIFDEMNLSQIEHWFAPFISLLEQDPDSRVLKLYSDSLYVKNGEKYPSLINIGENVFFIGTVNIDETTKQISDRLLDRAIVINLASPSFTNLKNMEKTSSDIYPEVTYSRFATAIAKVENAALAFDEEEFSLINDLRTLLTESIYNKSISFRSLNKMALYLKNSKDLLTRNDVIDFMISQIVVKKINGSREELEDILSDDDTQGILKILNDYSNISEFKKTRKIIYQKIQELNKYGFTR